MRKITTGDKVTLIEASFPSMLIVGQEYTTAEINGNVIKLSNGVWTYLDRFERKENAKI